MLTTFAPLELDEVNAVARLMTDSFNTPEDKAELWITRSGIENWRTLKGADSSLLGGLMRIPMGQWFGGRKVSMTGLAGVAISTAGRGRRAGQELMRETLAEMRRDKVALSALYGSTTSFYRRCGYERAGSRFLAEVPLRDLTARGGPLEVRPLDADNQQQAEDLQRQCVRGHGSLVRGPYLWHRVRGPRGMTAQGYGFYRGETLEGYTYQVKDCTSFRDNAIEATDLVLTTPDAVSTFLGHLAGHRAFFTSARWPSAPDSPVLMRLTEPWHYTLRLDEHWLLRIVDLPEALTQRGYPEHLNSELHLAVSDAWFPENDGCWILTVQKGQATVERGGRGDLVIDIGALAALYSGFSKAEDLALAGKATAPPSTLSLATAIFGGAVPTLADFF